MKIKELSTGKIYDIEVKREGENPMPCPVCSGERKKQKDRCFSWNAEHQVGHCNHCGADFVLYRLFEYRSEKTYSKPAWTNKTELSDKALRWFESRKISQKTLNAMRVYSALEYMPQHGMECEVMCFTYFRGGELVNIKYRGPKKSFKLFSGAELIFYNLDAVAESEQIIITEGEMDALSFFEAGMKNVISVPNGAQGKNLEYLDSCIAGWDNVKVFYLATDIDEAGITLRRELIRRLGAHRCRIVSFEGLKDANELLCAKGTQALRNALHNSVELPVENVFNLEKRYDDIKNLFDNGSTLPTPVGSPTDEFIHWKTGALAVITGIPSHGKSEVLNFLAVRWNISLGWKTAFFSPENMPYDQYLYPKLFSLISGSRFARGYVSGDEFESYFDYINDNFKFIDAGDDFSVETIIDTAKNLVYRCGIKAIIVDPFNCFEHRQAKGETETQYIGRFLDILTRFAKQHDVLVCLVAHPTKMQREGRSYERPGLYNLSGSANFYNKADIGITIYRRFEGDPAGIATEFIVTKIRHKGFGKLGVVDMQYNFINGRYSNVVYDVNRLDNTSYLTQGEHGPMQPSIEVNVNEECPF